MVNYLYLFSTWRGIRDGKYFSSDNFYFTWHYLQHNYTMKIHQEVKILGAGIYYHARHLFPISNTYTIMQDNYSALTLLIVIIV